MLVSVVFLRFHLGNAHFRLEFIVTPTLAARFIIGTSFMDQHVKAIH